MKARGAEVAKMQRRLPRPNHLERVFDKGGEQKTKNSGKLSKASKAMQTSESIETARPEAKASERKAPPLKQELIAPHEWASLLNNIENHADETHVGGEVLGEVELFSDELWERLSSTRWIKPPREDFHNHTTVVNRPKDAAK